MTQSTTDDPLIALRARIIEAMKMLSPEHEWVTTEMVVKFLEMKYAKSYSLSKIGNNLRVLREHRVVEDRLKRGLRWWKTTGVDYSPDPAVKLLISFPKTIHDRIVAFSKKGEMSKNAFVVNMVTTGIKNLSSIREPVVGLPPPPVEVPPEPSS